MGNVKPSELDSASIAAFQNVLLTSRFKAGLFNNSLGKTPYFISERKQFIVPGYSTLLYAGVRIIINGDGPNPTLDKTLSVADYKNGFVTFKPSDNSWAVRDYSSTTFPEDEILIATYFNYGKSHSIIGSGIKSNSETRPFAQKVAQAVFWEKFINYISDGTNNRFCFSSAPDVHESFDSLRRYNHLFSDLSYLVGKVKFHAVQGDIMAGGGTKAEFMAQLATFMDYHIGDVTPVPLFVGAGNHDFNSDIAGVGVRDADVVLTNEEFYDSITGDAVTAYSFVVDAANPKGNYYYYDFTTEKIRVVMLNQYVYPETTTDGDRDFTPMYPLHGIRGYERYGEAQLNWVVNHALNVPDADYHVIILTHDVLTSTVYQENNSCLIAILNAFEAGSAVSYECPAEAGMSGYTIAGDFNEINGFAGVVACCVHGDGHVSMNGTLPGSTILTIGVTSAQPAMLTENRVIGSPTEDMVDFFIIDKIARTIRVVRYGATLVRDEPLSVTADRFLTTPLEY